MTALCLAVACGGDDDGDNTASGGKTNSGGASSGGKASSGGTTNSSGGTAVAGSTAKGGGAGASSGGKASGGSSSGGTGGAGGTGDAGGGAGGTGGVVDGGAGGFGGEPAVTCEPPPPPVVGGEGGAGGAGGGSSVGTEAGAGGGNGTSTGVAIAGSYHDAWGHYVISNAAWVNDSSTYHISRFDNAQHFVIARNDQGNGFSPCLWSRFDWTRVGGKLYYCQSAYGAVSEAAALATPAADPSSPTTGGCGGGFPWSELSAD
ncbi:MAG: hypothetical protein QM756_04505 [Polyangiaceae bacterium]